MYDIPRTIEQNLAILAAAPAHLAELAKPLSAAQLATAPEADEWSARDVLANHACSHSKQFERIAAALSG